jgi:hypothetical protein
MQDECVNLGHKHHLSDLSQYINHIISHRHCSDIAEEVF